MSIKPTYEEVKTQLDTIRSISSLAAADVKTVADHILLSIVKSTGSAYGFYGFVNEDESSMTIHAWSGEAMKDCKMVDTVAHFPIKEAGVWGEAVRRREPFILNDYGAWHPAKKGFPVGHVQLTNLMVVPLMTKGRITSVAAVANRSTNYGMDDVTQLTMFLDSIQTITDGKRAEAALQAKEKENISMWNELLIGFMVHAADTSITFCNEKSTAVFGLTYDQMIGKKIDDPAWHFVNEDLTTMPVEDYPVSRVISTKKPCHDYIVGIKRADRENITWVITNAAPVFLDDNKVEKVILNFLDITELKKSEEAIKRSESMHSKMVANIGDVIVILDQDGANRYQSPNIEKLFGWKPEDVVGASAWANAHPEDKGSIQRFLGHLMEEPNAVGTIELRFKCKDGNFKWVEFTGSNLLHDSSIRGILGNYHDITDRKKRESELQRLRNDLDNIINSMPSMLVGIDAKGTITYWNRKAEKVTGRTADEVVGKPLDKVMPRLSVEMGRVHRAIRSGQEQSDHKRSWWKNGNLVFEDLTIYPLITNGMDGAVIRIDDVTEKVRLEEMIVQSEKMLSVGGLAAGMAHEINNPLAGMIQTAQVMAIRLEKASTIPANIEAAETAGTSMEAIGDFMEARGIHRMIDTIVESGQRVAEIVSNMLSFARKSNSQAAPQSLVELMDRTLELAATDYDLKRHYDFKLIEVVRVYDENLPPVPCEGAKIQQVLLNLLRNGAQAMQEKKTPNPRFTIRAYAEETLRMVCLDIADNGPGMDEDTRKRVFEPFFTTKPVGIGTGLGLSVSYFIITENHNGQMNVASTPGRGTTFFIRLPMEGAPPASKSLTKRKNQEHLYDGVQNAHPAVLSSDRLR